MAQPDYQSVPWRVRRLLGRAVRRAARPALAGPGSPVQELRERVEGVERVADALPATVESVRGGVVEHLDSLGTELETRLQAEGESRVEVIHALESVRRRVEGLESELTSIDEFVAGSRALPYMEHPLEQFDAPGAGRVLGFRDNAADASDRPYVAFEDVFRGSEDRVRDLQRPYVGLIGDRAPVLDAGCGRGELLDLMRDAGVEAVGVDMDAGMVARCREKGHEDVHEGDAIAYLEGLEPHALGVVFSAQVIEHLPHQVLERLFAASARALRPGGLLIVETVNPHAPSALKAFWLDPTHQHPLFPEVVIELCRIAGFASAYAFHPNGSGDVEADRYRMPSYAVVATAR